MEKKNLRCIGVTLKFFDLYIQVYISRVKSTNIQIILAKTLILSSRDMRKLILKNERSRNSKKLLLLLLHNKFKIKF